MSEVIPGASEPTEPIPTDEQVVAYFGSLPEGDVPYAVFLAAAKRFVVPTIEMVPLRTHPENGTEVLLMQRPENDPWSRMWHVPGQILRATDSFKPSGNPAEYYTDAFHRIFNEAGELKSGVTVVNGPVEVKTEPRETRRGKELSVLHWAEVIGEPVVGRFFAINDFPHNVPEPGVIPHHIDFIPRVVAHYEAHKSEAI